MDGKSCRTAQNTQGGKFRQLGEKDTQDKPRSFRELPDEWQRLILQAVPELDKRRSE